jgi:hypothetical protein
MFKAGSGIVVFCTYYTLTLGSAGYIGYPIIGIENSDYFYQFLFKDPIRTEVKSMFLTFCVKHLFLSTFAITRGEEVLF